MSNREMTPEDRAIWARHPERYEAYLWEVEADEFLTTLFQNHYDSHGSFARGARACAETLLTVRALDQQPWAIY